MARDTIKYLLKKEVEQMISYGEHKRDYQLQNMKDRQELKDIGVKYKDRLEVNNMQDKIFSISTVKNYMASIDRFGDFLIKSGHKKISIEECVKYVPDYIQFRRDAGIAETTIHAEICAIAKATHTHSFDYERIERSTADITKGRNPKAPSHYNPAYEMNKIIGLRRNDLKRVRVCDIKEYNNRTEIVIKGCKGGKTNTQILYSDKDRQALRDYIKNNNLSGNDKLFEKDLFRNSLDFQSCRREAAQRHYREYKEDIEKNPERRDFYVSEINRIFKSEHRDLKENLDRDIYLRGKVREHAKELDKDVEYSRVCIMMTSLSTLSHFRSGVTINNYLI